MAQLAVLGRDTLDLAGDVPVLRADTGRGVEQTPGVDLLLVSVQAGVVGRAVERLLEVGLQDVGLAHVGTSLGAGCAPACLPVVGKLQAGSGDSGSVSISVPRDSLDGVQDSLAPSGVDGAVGVAASRVGSNVEGQDGGALLNDVADGSDGLVEQRSVASGRLKVGTGEQTRGSLEGGDTDRLQGEVQVPAVVKVVVVEVLQGVDRDTESSPVSKQRSQQSLELGLAQLGGEKGSHGEEVGARGDLDDVKVRVGAGIGEDGQVLEVGSHGVPEQVLSDVAAADDVESGDGDLELGVGLDGDRGNNTKCAATTTSQSPEQVGVGGRRGGHELAVGQDNLHGEDLVSSHTVDRGQGRVATTEDVATHDTDGLALTTDNGDAVLVSSLVQLKGLDTGAELEGRAGVAIEIEIGVELDLLEVVGPDGQGTGTGRLASEIVASVLDDETEVGVTGEVDGELDLGDVADGDSVRGEATERALVRGRGGGHAGQALVQGPHDGGRVIGVDVRVVGPVVGQEGTLRRALIAPVGVAGRGQGHSLDESAGAEQEAEDVPNQRDGVEDVAGHDLALGAAAALAAGAGGGGGLIVKVEDVDAGQVQRGQVGDDVGGQLDGLGGEQVNRRVGAGSGNISSGRCDGVGIGGCLFVSMRMKMKIKKEKERRVGVRSGGRCNKDKREGTIALGSRVVMRGRRDASKVDLMTGSEGSICKSVCRSCQRMQAELHDSL